MHRAAFLFCLLPFAFCLTSCDRRQPLTAELAQQIIDARRFKAEPVYAEVPQRVWWSTRAPKDDYDEKALRTLHHLRDGGYVAVTSRPLADGGQEHIARVTQKGFPILGTAPSYRGPVYRAKIAEKVYDGLRDFVRHPNDPNVGAAQLVWHYDNPTPMYPLFETKINKPLDRPFASHVAFYYKDHEWKFNVTVRKTEAGE